MRILNRDQVQRMRMIDEKEIIKSFMTKALAAFAVFFLMSLAVALHAVNPSYAAPVAVSAVDRPDFMISPDFADYMHRQGSGYVFNEMDVE